MSDNYKSLWITPFKMLLNPIGELKKEEELRKKATVSVSFGLVVTFICSMVYFFLIEANGVDTDFELSSIAIGSVLLFGLVFPCVLLCFSMVVYTMGFSIGNRHKDGDFWVYFQKIALIYSAYLTGISTATVLLQAFPTVALIVNTLIALYLVFGSMCAYSSLSSVGYLRGMLTHFLIAFWTFVAMLVFT